MEHNADCGRKFVWHSPRKALECGHSSLLARGPSSKEVAYAAWLIVFGNDGCGKNRLSQLRGRRGTVSLPEFWASVGFVVRSVGPLALCFEADRSSGNFWRYYQFLFLSRHSPVAPSGHKASRDLSFATRSAALGVSCLCGGFARTHAAAFAAALVR